ncbi:sensor histidine kinase [Kribbella endophytica]
MEAGRPTRTSGIGLAAGTVAVLLVSLLFVAGAPDPATLIAPVVITSIAIAVSVWAVIRSRRQRREYEERLTAWAGEQAVQAERLRIARDLHDLVSHGLGLITIRAAVARRAGANTPAAQHAASTATAAALNPAPTNTATGQNSASSNITAGPHPTFANTPTGQDAASSDVTAGQHPTPADLAAALNAALTDIEQVSRGTTTELRRMLNVLRSADGEPAPLRPAETLDDLPAIVEEARAAGLQVALDLPELDEVSPGAQLTICAVAREALNNTLRHCGPTQAHLAVRREDGVLLTSYRDEGPVTNWTAHHGVGHGLTGLHERVTALGGTLKTGPNQDGFQLIARLPDGPSR